MRNVISLGDAVASGSEQITQMAGREAMPRGIMPDIEAGKEVLRRA